ncbi:hypothetical protein [Streptomyces sp. NPDC054940]
MQTGGWLLSAHPSPPRARLEWQEHKVALLPLGTLFSAVRTPGRLVFELVGAEEPDEVDPFLDDALDGGPIICDPHQRRYYALLPASTPRNWRTLAQDWQAQLGVDILDRGTYLGVPQLSETEANTRSCASYWAVPMLSAAMLCSPLKVAELLATVRRSQPTEQP